MTRIAIIADDLTGALDTASPFACYGLTAIVALDVDHLESAVASGAEVLGVSTNSRHLGAEEATVIAATTARILKNWAPNLILKKVDSRLKGNLASETVAITEVFQFSQVVVAVAAPDVGRFVDSGKVTGSGVGEPLDVASRFHGLHTPVSIRNSLSDHDMGLIAAEWNGDDATLYVCSRGLAVAFAKRFGRTNERPLFQSFEPVVVAIGSRDPVTDHQVEMLCRSGNFLRVKATDGQVVAQDLSADRIVYQCAGEMLEPAHVVSQRFAGGISAAITVKKPRTLVLSGGDTTLAVLNMLGVGLLEICGEAAPGLPWFMIPLEGGMKISAISKSGGFGDADTLHRMLVASPDIRLPSRGLKVHHGSH
jgi:uncharacterized protein YgbK (DUF1537 family)